MNLVLRKADEKDVDILFEWANDEIVRKNSFSTKPILYEEHVQWYKKLLEDSNRVQYILEKVDQDRILLVGQIRIDINVDEQCAEIGYSIATEYRGMGYGKAMLHMLNEEVKREYPFIQKFVAKVKPTNVASYKVFIDSGYELKYNELELNLESNKKSDNFEYEADKSENLSRGGVILLTNNTNSLYLYNLIEKIQKVIIISDPINVDDIERFHPELIVSYNYMHIVHSEVIRRMGNRIINMHISYLPWNRGANPNFWSFVDDTPKGVTIHYLTEELDKGDILFQKQMVFDESVETFASTYEKLHESIVRLLMDNWKDIYEGITIGKKQCGKGSYHSIADFKRISEQLKFAWDDKIEDVLTKYRQLMEKMKYLYIRVDMNNIIATGHVMRCLSIADAAKLIGIESIFLLADSNAIELLQSKGYSYIVLNTQWNKLDLECDIICDIVQQKRIDILLIDTYQVTDNYLRKLSEITKTIYIDDINKMIYPVHGIICYANYWKKFIYEEQYREALNRNMIKRMPEFYLGCSYAPLRQEFSNTSRKCIKDNPESLLIMSGGTDPYDIIGQVLASIDRKRYREINAICGRLNSNVEELRLKYEQEENVHIFSSVLNMIDYMKQADIAISAGGTTLYELCAVGTPTITYSFADNQLDNVRSFEEDGIMNYAGDARCDSVGENVERLLRDYVKIGVRKQKSKRMQNLVDGYGANRICNSFTAKSM